MDSRQAEELLKKYWNCDTTLEEEEQLRTYFSGTDVQDDLKETATLFKYFENQKLRQVEDQRFESKVVDHLKGEAIHNSGKIRKLVYASMRIAAGVAVLLAAIYVVRLEVRKDSPVAVTDTYDTPEQAFEETKKALMMISRGFGRAEQQVKKINVFNEAQEKIKDGPVEDEQNL